MQQKTESQSCVITDANILINFIKLGRVDILQQLRMYAFYLSEEVYTVACNKKGREGFIPRGLLQIKSLTVSHFCTFVSITYLLCLASVRPSALSFNDPFSSVDF